MDNLYLVMTKELEDLTENEIAHHLRIALDERMHNTADGTLAKLSFVLTLRGFCWFQQQSQNVRQANFLQRPSETLRLARVQVNNQIKQMRHGLDHICSSFRLKNETADVDFESYLDGNGPKRGCDLLKFWNTEADRDPDLFDFAKTVWLLLQIQASESAAERAFSVLQTMFPRCRALSNEKLLEAELRIQLE
jgi:hypothetical protein